MDYKRIWNDQSKIDINMFHDVALDVLGTDLKEEELHDLFLKFPKSIAIQVDEWGFCDTVVRENIHEYLSRSKTLDELSKQAQDLNMGY